MDWINRLNSAINYIEEEITNEIDMEKVGNIAGCSSYHFQRMFAYMADAPLSVYTGIAIDSRRTKNDRKRENGKANVI